MHGNVWEWTTSRWTENLEGVEASEQSDQGGESAYYVLRGGCWHDLPDLYRSAVRLKQPPHEAEDYFGFRIAL